MQHLRRFGGESRTESPILEKGGKVDGRPQHTGFRKWIQPIIRMLLIQFTNLRIWEGIAHLIGFALRHMPLRNYFFLWQTRYRVNVHPVHFYNPIPDLASIPSSFWQKMHFPKGIEFNPAGQQALLKEFTQWMDEYEAFPRESSGVPLRFYLNNGVIQSVDAEALYCMIRRFQPRRIIEIGSGWSTLLIAQALRKNQSQFGCRAEYVVIDPFPYPLVLEGNLPEVTKILRCPLEGAMDQKESLFGSLRANDLLFIDSSHVIKMGNDGYYLYLDIIPSLCSGVLVHIHDIFTPAEYPPNLALRDQKFFNEQYILEAFLMFNQEFEVIFAASFMHRHHPEMLARTFPSHNLKMSPPGSFWIRRKSQQKSIREVLLKGQSIQG